MGLDGVEILIEVEDRFGVTITDAEAQGMRTVGDLLTLINARIEAASETRCRSLPAFLQVRRLLRDFLAQPTLRVRPSAAIATIVPARRRGELWRELSQLLGGPAPPLRRPKPLRAIMFIAALAALALGLSTALVDVTILPLGGLLAVAFVLMLQLFTAPLCIEPPENMQTVGDLTQRVVGLTAATRPTRSTDEVLAEVQAIVSKILGVDRDEVVPEARFVEDLDMQ